MRDGVAHTITTSQCKYVIVVLKQFEMEECKAIATPLDVKSKLVKLTEEVYVTEAQSMSEVPYKQAVGSLMYVIITTRPNFAFPICVVSQHMARLSSIHWVAVKKIMRYLKGTSDIKFCLRNDTIVLRGYCDADYA